MADTWGPATFTTSSIPLHTHDIVSGIQSVLSAETVSTNNDFPPSTTTIATSEMDIPVTTQGQTLNGVVIGLLSSFGSAILIALIVAVIYFFKYTQGGRILLDRIGRPGEYDDEQAFLKEEAEALEGMDDLQKTEYLRAKGMFISSQSDWFLPNE